jgi:hypothetical protein
LQVGSFFGHDRPFDRANLQANAAINASRKINPTPVGAFGIFARARMDAGDWAGIYAIGNAFACVGNNGVWHRYFRLNQRLICSQ